MTTKLDDFLGLPVHHAWLARGCDQCRGTGYAGRMLLAELLLPGQDIFARSVLARADVRQLEEAAVAAGMIDRWVRACTAVESGSTSPAEVRRILGVAPIPAHSRENFLKPIPA